MTNKQKGTALIISAAFFFNLMSVFSKLAGNVPVMQKTLFRNLVAAAFTGALMLARRQPFSIPRRALPAAFLRSGFGMLAVVGFLYAVDHLVLSDAAMIQDLSPFFIIAAAALILKEKPRSSQLALIFVAMVGTAFVIKPSGAMGLDRGTLAALTGALATGVAYTMLRVLGKMDVDVISIVLFFSLFTCAACVPFVVYDHAHLDGRSWLYLILMSLSACIGQLSITGAYRFAPAKEISIYDYTEVVFASVMGWLVFGEVAGASSYIGYVIIAGAAIVMYLMNRRLPDEGGAVSPTDAS